MSTFTEEQAKTRWCPLSRVLAQTYNKKLGTGALTSIGGGYNRRVPPDEGDGITIPAATACIGCQCMAWRWNRDPAFNANNKQLSYCGAFGRLEAQ